MTGSEGTVYKCPNCGKFMKQLENPDGEMKVMLECSDCGETLPINELEPVKEPGGDKREPIPK